MDIHKFYMVNFDVVGTVEEGLKEYEQLKNNKVLEKEIKNNIDIYKLLMSINMSVLEGKKVKVILKIE